MSKAVSMSFIILVAAIVYFGWHLHGEHNRVPNVQAEGVREAEIDPENGLEQLRSARGNVRSAELVTSGIVERRAVTPRPVYRIAGGEPEAWKMFLRGFPDLQEGMGFTPEETRKFFELINTPLSGAVQKAAVEGLIGSERMQAWKEYQKSIASRRRMSELRTMLVNSSYPLSRSQEEAMLPLVMAERDRRSALFLTLSSPTDMATQIQYEESKLKIMEASYAREAANLKGILHPTQLALVKSRLESHADAYRSNLKVRRAQLEAGILGIEEIPRPALQSSSQ